MREARLVRVGSIRSQNPTGLGGCIFSGPVINERGDVLDACAKTYPVDDWERKRNIQIIRWQGRGNPWVTEPAKLKASCG